MDIKPAGIPSKPLQRDSSAAAQKQQMQYNSIPLPSKLPPQNVKPMAGGQNYHQPPKAIDPKARNSQKATSTTSERQEIRPSQGSEPQTPSSLPSLKKQDSLELKPARQSSGQQDQQKQSPALPSASKQSQLPPQTSKPSIMPQVTTIDPAIHKLAEKNKRLVETIARLQQEKSQLEVQLSTQASLADSQNNEHWSLSRDKLIKTELLRTKMENHKLRSSTKNNERFGELLISCAKDVDNLAEKALAVLEAGAREARLATEVLAEVIVSVNKIASSLAGARRDYENLWYEGGSQGNKQWDGQFGESDAHSLGKLFAEIAETLFDYEGKLVDKISRIDNSPLSDVSEINTLRDTLVDEAQALLKKSLQLTSYHPSHKNVQEFKKKLKPITELSVTPLLARLEAKLSDNIRLTQDSSPVVIKAIVEQEVKALKGAERTSQLLAKIAIQMTFLEIYRKGAINDQLVADLKEKVDYFIREFTSGVAQPVYDLLNHLERQQFGGTVFFALRETLIRNIGAISNPIYSVNPLKGYVEELLVHLENYLKGEVSST